MSDILAAETSSVQSDTDPSLSDVDITDTPPDCVDPFISRVTSTASIAQSSSRQRLRFANSDHPAATPSPTGSILNHTNVFDSPLSTPLSKPSISPSHSRASSGTVSTLSRRSVTSSRSSSSRPPWPSTRLKGELEKPWLKHIDPAHRWTKVVFWVVFVLGLAGAGALCYFGYAAIPSLGKTCLIMDDTFSTGINPDFWSHEVRIDGYGNSEFEWTTDSPNNSFVQDNTLYIVPTLTSDVIGHAAVTNGYTLNLTADGTCTSNNISQCVVVSNSTTGTIINPVRSARIITKNKVSLRYGKVEVEARMPTGDWIWPAIWMLPVDDVYGAWPLSGEIDIAESRGNDLNYAGKGSSWIASTLHWGPLSVFDSYWRTASSVQDKVHGFDNDFHKYTLEWNDKYLMTYIDSKINQIYAMKFDQSFWNRGQFPTYFTNGTDQQKLANPWAKSPNNAAPFDQEFYLILNVAVGGQNGYFPNNVGNKPWDDSASTAMSDFWAARDEWFPTWPNDVTKRALAVRSVKVWNQC